MTQRYETTELMRKAQAAAEERMHMAWRALEETDVDDDGTDLLGPYCGCLTCEVREVLDAAWPWLYLLAHHPNTEPPDGRL